MQARSTRSVFRRGVAFCSVCLFVSTLGAAQTLPPASAPPPDPFAAEPMVIQQMVIVYSFNPDGTGFREQTFAVRIQSEATLRAFSVLGIPFAGNSERVHFRYARVRHRDGVVVQTDPGTAIEQAEQVTREAPLYSDLKQQQLPIKSLGVGDTLEWQVHIDRTRAEAAGEFWGRQALVLDGPALSELVELRVPATRKVNVWTNPESKLSPKVTTEGDQQVYRWSASSLTTTVGAEAEAAKKTKSKAALSPAEQVDALQGKFPDIAWTSFASWDAVGAWYRALEAGRTQPNPAITARVAELTAGKTSPEDKVRAVYNYVAGQIHYIGVDFGVGRYQPHPAADVIDNQYGDCKDKHTLLASMLADLGLHADAVLIGSNVRFNPAVPAPDSFNHLITHLRLGEEDVWLDSTTEVAPYRMIFASIRDKEALLVPEAGPSTIARTPKDPPFPTFEKMTASGALDSNGTSESHFSFTQRGDEELLTRLVLRQVTPAQYDELTQRLVANMGFGGTVSHARFLNLNDTTQPLVMEWDYHREKAGNDWDNLRTVPQVMMVLLPTVDESDPPIQDILLYGARDVTATSQMKLPAGWSAELPEAIHTRSAYGTYDLTFRYASGVLYAERHWTVLKTTVPQPDWKKYKSWIDTVAPGTEPYVQLRRADGQPTSAKISAAPPADSASLRYIGDAYAAIRDNRLDEGAALLEKARALDPNQRNLWGDYGWLALRRGDHIEAMRLYRKELDAYPDSLWAYAPLSGLQAMSGDSEGAVATLRKYVVQAPRDPDAAAILIETLARTHRLKEASQEADAALLRLPENARTKTRFQVAVVQAELRDGKADVGVATALQVLENTTDPQILNNVAYELALANQKLTLAETTEHDVLQTLTSESKTWTLDEALPQLLARSSLLTAAWDTMGMILFRQAKPADAEPLIAATWRYRPAAEVGEHLGDVQLARGEKTAALRSFQLALGTIDDHNAMGVRSQTAPEGSSELRQRILNLHGSALPDTPSVLQAMRTIRLPSALSQNGVAEYKLLLSSSGILRAEPVGKKELPGGADLLHKAPLPAELFPSGSAARLVRLGTLNCHAGVCELIFQP